MPVYGGLWWNAHTHRGRNNIFCTVIRCTAREGFTAKTRDENPYMAKSDANIHHDGYNTDSTDEILPLGIYPEINVSFETTNPNASPAIYFDNYGHAVVPLLGGIAIRDLNATETKTLGYFSPMQHDGGGYVIQSSYTFLDSKNRIVCPTSNNHVLILRTTEEDGSVIPEFEKLLGYRYQSGC